MIGVNRIYFYLELAGKFFGVRDENLRWLEQVLPVNPSFAGMVITLDPAIL